MADEYVRKQDAIDTLAEQIALCDKALKSFEISMKDEYAVKVERASLIAYKEQLEAITAADVVPVVRCKDCKHHTYDEIFSCYWCEYPGRVMDTTPDGFCEKGEE